jgi:hypothetical protein
VVGAATSAITGGACSPYGFHWAFDTRALAVCTGGALVKAGGGQVVGSSRAAELVGLLLLPAAAQSSKAKIVGLANAGQIDLPVCDRNMPGKKTDLPERKPTSLNMRQFVRAALGPARLLSHGRAQAVVITPGYRLHAPSE